MSQSHILVFLVRHGTTDLNQQGDYYRGPDVPLDKAGVQDANKLACYFSEVDTHPAIFHSSKIRTTQTARIISERKDGSNLQSVDGLANWDKGHLSGAKKTLETKAEVQYHVENPDIPIKGGESLNEFRGRIRPLIMDGVDIALESGLPVLIVGHSSIIHEVGEMLHDDAKACTVKPGGVAAIYIRDGKLAAEPVFKPEHKEARNRAEIVS